MLHRLEREIRASALPLFLAVVAIAIILRSFLMVMDRRAPVEHFENEDATQESSPPTAYAAPQQRHAIVPDRRLPQNHRRPQAYSGSRGRHPASIGPAYSTAMQFQPRSIPAFSKKRSSFLARTIGQDAVKDLKDLLSGEDRTQHFLQRELNLTESDLQLIKDEKMRLYAKLRELDQQKDPAKTRQERTTLLQQHKAWMESVIGAEGYQKLQQIRGL